MQVKDGDTVVISPIEGGQFFICRLYGIDAPETPKNGKPGQPYGEESTKELKKLILGQEVTAEIRDRDKYNLEVSVIRKGVKDMNLEMISRGAAWAYRKYLKPPYASEYIEAESAARGKGLGLWQQSNPEPPWEFRKK
jgi:endonuclease YncB( thermonuclease family)